MSYIYEEYDYSLFESRFRDYDRYDQLGGYDGLSRLYEYLDDLAECTGMPIKMDTIGLCCEWSYYTLEELKDAYFNLLDEDQEEEDIVDELAEHTTIIKTADGNYLVQEF